MIDTVLPDHKIHLATVADATDIAECLSALGYGTSASLVAERLASFATSSIDTVLVASTADQASLLGVVSVHLLPLFHAPGFLGRITSLAVNAEARGKGVGKALVTAAEEWAWGKGARRMEVTSGDHRPVAHAFYQAVGYSLDERRFIKHAAKAG
jgi:GNAT superfamily N-acetyltransferase